MDASSYPYYSYGGPGSYGNASWPASYYGAPTNGTGKDGGRTTNPVFLATLVLVILVLIGTAAGLLIYFLFLQD